MSSQIHICNMALSHIGIGKEIATLIEKSEEANACNRFYETTVKQVFRDYPWPFSTKIAALGLLEENPNDEWLFSYAYPSDCLNARRILSGIRSDTRQSRSPFEVSFSDSAKIIFSDQIDAELKYTLFNDDPITYPSDFQFTVSYLLAALIAPRLTGGDRNKLGVRSYQNYLVQRSISMANSSNESQVDEEPESEFIRARGFVSDREFLR